MLDKNFSYSGTDYKAKIIETNKVLRNTYLLLGITLLWSAIMAGISTVFQLPGVHWIISLIVMYGTLFFIEKNRHSTTGLMLTFFFTGFMGYSLGPIFNAYIGAGMGDLILTALSGTALTFFALSAFALTTKKDLSVLNGLIFVGFFVLLVCMIANIFLQLTIFSLVISGLFILFSSAIILVTTQNIIRGGEDSYISATITLYISIYNIFISLLQILGIMSSDD